MKKLIVVFLFFFTFISSNANEEYNHLDQLFIDLKTNNSTLTPDIEQKIWKIWSTHPTNQKLTILLGDGSKLVRDRQLSRAVEIFTEVISIDPLWAEAWNKRATVLYMLKDYTASQSDIEQVLKLEERHFGALAGQGLVNIKLENYEKALESYKKAKEIYPTMKSHSIMIEKIKKLIQRELI